MRSRHRVSKRIQTIALVGSYVPRACGIATFTKDLRDALADQMGDRQTMVLALDDLPEGYPYPAEVRFQIDVARSTDYRVAADLLNMHEIDAVMLQHEYGIYGGEDGAYVLDLIERLRMPVITTLHTVLTEPSSGQRRALEAIAERSDRLVVMSHLAEGILESVYGVGSEKVAYIPHGIPDVPFVDASFYKDQFGVEGRTVLLTFGLLSPGKGIEVAIRAMPRIVERFPDVIYMVLGATHPHILRTQGNAYRQSLERLARDLGVRNHVVFHNRFVNLNELIGYVGSADIYILPYPQKAQITSGTLAYALGAGKAVVSTPFWYAEEMLADGRGRLFPFNDSEKLSEAVIDLLENGSERDAMRKRAYLHTRSSVWPEVARSYLRLAGQVIRERARRPRPVTFYRAEDDPAVLPEPSLAHVRRLTDDTGILQHAVYAVPNRFHGYCTDDNARALIAVLEYYDLYGDESVLELVDTYLAFLHHAFNRDQRRFRNFLSYDRRWLETIGSEDSHGRALQALGVAVEHASNDATLTVATRLFHESLERAEEFHSPRSCAFAAIGIQSYLARFGGDTRARRTRDTLARRILNAFRKFATESWPWCEETVT
ncbi:MAG TPA: glycosyltransferase family 4 protein, partial [Planctomycetota bacterium]|nr:glycosyltransferase family 4 protein [Planctomycetota bacterium]